MKYIKHVLFCVAAFFSVSFPAFAVELPKFGSPEVTGKISDGQEFGVRVVAPSSLQIFDLEPLKFGVEYQKLQDQDTFATVVVSQRLNNLPILDEKFFLDAQLGAGVSFKDGDNNLGWSYGATLNYAISEKVSVGASYIQYSDDENDQDVLSLSVGYKF
jgi:hypothetical protein